MRQVSVFVTLRSNTLIDLKYMHACPWNVFSGKSTKHHPRRVTSANSHNETAACGNGVSGLRGDHCGSFPGD
jgi:hypothetical protein